MSDLQALADTFRRTQRKLYLADRECEIDYPSYLLFRGDELATVVPLDMPKEMAELARDALADFCDHHGLDVFMYVSEGWMRDMSGTEDRRRVAEAKKDSEGMPLMGPLSEDPKSIEVLLITVGDRAGRRLKEVWQLHREAEEDEGVMTLKSRWDSENMKEGDEVIDRWDLWDRPSIRKSMN